MVCLPPWAHADIHADMGAGAPRGVGVVVRVVGA